MRSPYHTYRPLRCGIAILSRKVDQYGTLGFFGYGDDGAQWLVSCYHVLCRVDFGAYVAGEEIFQPDYNREPAVIATLADRADPVLDCAAALLQPGVVGLNEVLGLGAFNPRPAVPVVGMRVCKFGVATEMTEGVVSDVVGDTVHIRPHPSFSTAYELSQIGDSGALWLEQGTLRPVALHKEGQIGDRLALGSAITAVLQRLALKL